MGFYILGSVIRALYLRSWTLTRREYGLRWALSSKPIMTQLGGLGLLVVNYLLTPLPL